MRRYRNPLNLPLTLVSLMVGWVLNRLSNALAPDELVWWLHDLTLAFCFASACSVATQFTPYDHLRMKCIAAAVMAMAWLECAYLVGWHAFGLRWYQWFVVVQGASGLLAIAFYWRRSYDQVSDPLDNDHLFCLRRRPANLQDFLIAAAGCYGAAGGFALYASGALYCYRRGRLQRVKTNHLALSGYQVIRGARLSAGVIDELESAADRAPYWSVRHNCLTVLAPIWERNRNAA